MAAARAFASTRRESTGKFIYKDPAGQESARAMQIGLSVDGDEIAGHQ